MNTAQLPTAGHEETLAWILRHPLMKEFKPDLEAFATRMETAQDLFRNTSLDLGQVSPTVHTAAKWPCQDPRLLALWEAFV
jgi:hypothetical protein